jgi:hypothetical protein
LKLVVLANSLKKIKESHNNGDRRSNNQQQEQKAGEGEPRAIKMAQGLQSHHVNNKSQQNKEKVIKQLEEEGKIKGKEESQQGGEEYEDEEPRQGQ